MAAREAVAVVDGGADNASAWCREALPDSEARSPARQLARKFLVVRLQSFFDQTNAGCNGRAGLVAGGAQVQIADGEVRSQAVCASDAFKQESVVDELGGQVPGCSASG